MIIYLFRSEVKNQLSFDLNILILNVSLAINFHNFYSMSGCRRKFV